MEEKMVWLEAQIGKEEYMIKLLEDEEGSLRDLSGIQDQIEEAARKIAHLTKGERKQIIRHTPEDVKNREVAAASGGRLKQHKLPGPASYDNKLVAETLGVAREHRTNEKNMDVWHVRRCFLPVWTSRLPLTTPSPSTWRI